MKRITCILFCFLLLQFANAQNLVPNGNFESITSCPSFNGQIGLASPWRRYHFGGTSDIFNACHTGMFVGVPRNFWGYQQPASGTGYGGAYAFTSTFNTSVNTEYLATSISSMLLGHRYQISMSVSLADSSGHGTNGIGIWLYDKGPDTTISGTGTLSVVPQISFATMGNIIDTQNWLRLTTLFVADSTYDNIVIGKFDPPSGLTTAIAGGNRSWSYYYYDSVVIRLVSAITNLYTDSMICAGDTFQVPYIVNTTLNSGNIFSVQISNSSGSFNSGTTIIGTRTSTTSGSISCIVPSTIIPSNNYKLRILSTNQVDSSNINPRISIGVVRPNISNSSNSPVCLTRQLNLTATSTTSGAQYRWEGPAGYSSIQQNPIRYNVQANASGDYIATSILFGCIAKDTTNVNIINTNASVNITSNEVVCESDTLKLNAIVVGNVSGHNWSGPLNFSSTSKDTIRTNIIPSMSGNYVLTAHYPSCTLNDTITILIKPLPNNRNINSNSPVCTGSTLNLISSSSSIGTTYTWSGPNNFTSTTANTSIGPASINANGKYILTYGLNGCTTKDSIIVTINPSPTAIIATATTPICERDTMRLFSTNSSTGVTWAWTGPGSYTASTQNPVRVSSTPSMSGDYIITATNSFSCTAKDTVTVLVKPLPANFNATAGTICEGSTLFLTGNSTSTGVSWSWTGPNSFTSTLQNPNIPLATTTASGAYILTATLNGCSDKDTAFGTVFPIPATPVPSANTPVCTGQDLKLTATNINSASFLWTSTTGYSSALQNPILSTATTAMAGKYYVQATANGCTSGIDSVTVTVNPAPVINMYPSPNDSICQGATLTFVSSQSNAGSAFQRTWYRNNNPITGANGVNYVTTATIDSDVYYVSLTGGNCAEPFTDTSSRILIRVFPWLAPKVSITANPTTTVPSGTMINFTATPTNGGNNPTYQWTRNGANIVGALSNVWGAPNLSNNDEICVNMTSSYLCPNPKTTKSNCIRVSIETTGIKGTWVGKQPAIYPNPVKDVLIIEGISTGTIIQLTDVAGRTLIRKTAISNNETINTQSLIPGNYILLLDDNKGSNIRVKITKE